MLACNPRKNAALNQGNRSDKIDARELANRLRLNDLKPVYHGENGIRMLRELARSFMEACDDVAKADRDLPLDLAQWHGFFFMFQPVDLAALKHWRPRPADKA